MTILKMRLSKEQADQIAEEIEQFAEWEVHEKYQWQNLWCVRVQIKYYPHFFITSMAEWRKLKFKQIELMLIADEARKLGLIVYPMAESGGVLFLEISAPRDHPLSNVYDAEKHEYTRVGFSNTRVGGLSTWNKIMGPLEDRTGLAGDAAEEPIAELHAGE